MHPIDDSAYFIHVVVAVIFNPLKRILITRRSSKTHQGGKWEFPGGKVEPCESATEALCRELNEELGIRPLEYSPLIKIRHEYSDKRVLLDVWRVVKFEGEPGGREGQPLKWVTANDLYRFQFPEANAAILTSVLLPSAYLITPFPQDDWGRFLADLQEALRNGVSFFRFRAHCLEDDEYVKLANQVVNLAHLNQAKVLLDRCPEWVEDLGADGLHLNSQTLMHINDRPLRQPNLLLAASCHNFTEIKQAAQIRADMVVVSPVKTTRSHPGCASLGWRQFGSLCNRAAMPVYALGGMKPEDIPQAQRCGGQGIAAIRSLWPAKIVA